MWDALPGSNYRLQYATNLNNVSWQDLSAVPVKLNNSYQVVEWFNDTARYYRLLSVADEP